MTYQQIPLTRLARASKKLVRDGVWHPFLESPRTYYRMADRFMQRVRLEDGEDDGLLLELKDFPPVPSKLMKEGFREELHFRIEDDHWVHEGAFIRAFIGWDSMKQGAHSLGAEITSEAANTIRFRVCFDRWHTNAVLQALAVARACTLVASDLAADVRNGIPHTDAEIRGLMRNAYLVLVEDCGFSVKKKRKDGRIVQASLFGEREEA